MKCSTCKKVHAYATDQLENQEKKCAVCGAQYRTILFRPVGIKSILPWLSPVVMALFFCIVMFLLSFPPLLRQFRFNHIVTTSNSLVPSILIPIMGAVVSILPPLLDFPSSNFKRRYVILISLVLLEGLVLVFVMNNVIEANFNSLQINDPNTNESQQYFGSVAGEYAAGQGRLFDSCGNLVYFGHFSNNLYNGYGEKYEQVNAVHISTTTEVYPCVYEGEFVDGVPSGQGKEYRYDAEYTFEKRTDESPYLYYQGEFLDGKYCGYGTIYQINSKYQGGFFDGRYNGYGNKWYIDSEDSKIYRMEGYYIDGALNGLGTKYYSSGQILFTGEYENGSATCTSGTIYFESGNRKYEGGFVNNQYDGDGTLYWENGNICYSGDWTKGSRSGYGTSYNEDGSKEYEGEWANNQFSGEGSWYWPTGKLYFKGHFENGMEADYGSAYNKHSILVYTGNFSEGKRNGTGIAYWSNGKPQYSGEWVDDKRSGRGTEYNIKGEVLHDGEFLQDNFIS